MRQTTFGVKGMLALLAAMIALPSFAGFYGPERRLNHLTIGSADVGESGSWIVSSPTLEGPSGYLAFDVNGKSPTVTFQRDKGPGTRWSFIEVTPFKHTEDDGPTRDRPTRKETTGYTMKLRASDGPYAGWYLGCMDKSLVLFKEPSKAATVHMVQSVREMRLSK